ncbi:hypothetical protein M9H77_07338 [Catharanthus roseus]|uniref:Uncharacterized protein n=1 Tax=Catharanthus roseus TaxID=4058 RepID=A0ACC0BUN6_CATRO|nr:hypothetical protein M9H77_07338 [Catharanthus roseus]
MYSWMDNELTKPTDVYSILDNHNQDAPKVKLPKKHPRFRPNLWRNIYLNSRILPCTTMYEIDSCLTEEETWFHNHRFSQKKLFFFPPSLAALEARRDYVNFGNSVMDPIHESRHGSVIPLGSFLNPPSQLLSGS